MEDHVEIPETGDPVQGRIISDIPVNTKTIERARAYVMDSKTYFESQRSDWEILNERRDRAYRAILEPPRKTSNNQNTAVLGRSYVGFDDKASPIIHDNVEAIKARLKESIIPINKDFVDIDSNVPEMQQVNEIRKNQINDQLNKNDIETKIETLAHNVAVFGVGYISVPFLNSEDVVLTRQLIAEEVPILDKDNNPVINSDGTVMTQIRQKLAVIPQVDKKYMGPGYDVVKDVEDIYLDRFIENIEDQPIVIRRFIVTWDHLVEGVQKGIYFEDAVMKIKDKISTTNKDESSRSERVLDTADATHFNTSVSQDGRPKEFEMFQAYCDFAVDETLEDGSKVERVYKAVISVIEDEVVQLMSNPYFHQQKPIIKVSYRPLPGEAYPLGAIDPVLDMFNEYNDTMNQINDSKMLAINPIKITTARSLADKQDLPISPGVEWVEKQPGDIRFAEFNFGPVSNGLQYLELLELKINRGMGVQRLMQGAGDDTDLDKTATGVTKVIEQADKKFRMIAKRIEDAAIRQWAEMAYKVNAQFLPITGPANFQNVNQELAFKVDGVDNFFDNIDQVNKLITFASQTAGVPQINTLSLVGTIAEKMDIEVNEAKFGPLFVQPPPPEKEEKPLNVSTNISLDPSKGTFNALAAAQVLSQKGIFIDLDAIGAGAEIITKDSDEQVKEESGLLPKEASRSIHTVRSSKGNTQTTVEREVSE